MGGVCVSECVCLVGGVSATEVEKNKSWAAAFHTSTAINAKKKKKQGSRQSQQIDVQLEQDEETKRHVAASTLGRLNGSATVALYISPSGRTTMWRARDGERGGRFNSRTRVTRPSTNPRARHVWLLPLTCLWARSCSSCWNQRNSKSDFPSQCR